MCHLTFHSELTDFVECLDAIFVYGEELKKKKRKSQNQPDLEDLIRSTDFLFLQADTDSVTVADVCKALAAEYDCKLSKATRRKVRSHLVDLMMGNVQPSVEHGCKNRSDS